jgi:hypothetical protein
MKPGDLVLPKEIYEPLYPDRTSLYDTHQEQTVYLWYQDKPGIVVKVMTPPGGSNATYSHVYILTGEHVGWTYSDFLLVICESR